MGERALVIDGDSHSQAMIEAFSHLLPEEREQILYLAQHPEELKSITRFEEILITGPSDQVP